MNKRTAKKVIRAHAQGRHSRAQLGAAIRRFNAMLNTFGLEATRKLLPDVAEANHAWLVRP